MIWNGKQYVALLYDANASEYGKEYVGMATRPEDEALKRPLVGRQ